jgi:hypothetical protein
MDATGDATPKPVCELSPRRGIGLWKDIEPTREDHEDDGIWNEGIRTNTRAGLARIDRCLKKGRRSAKRFGSIGCSNELP